MSIEKYQLARLAGLGLSIYNNQWSNKYYIEFEDLTDEETVCYIMCNLCGWSERRLSQIIKIGRGTIKKRIENAKFKRKIS